jgi:pimeloyl-ACP methyl ester carboxylesterase
MLTDVAKILLVHGAFHGAWCWDKLLPELEARHLDAEAVELPFTSPADDVAEVAGAIDRLAGQGEPIIAVGHSFGGSIITAAAGGDGGGQAASHLVYLTAVMQDPGEPLDLGETTTPGMRAIRFTGEEISIDPDIAPVGFYNRCKPGDAAWATAHLRPMPAATLTMNASSSVAWRSVPSTYVVCTDDQVLSPAMQRAMATNASASLEIDSDHSPFLSCPTELAGLLSSIISSV